MLVLPLCAASDRAAAAQGDPITPQVQEQGVDALSEDFPVLRWKPGDPVRVVPDLREDSDATTGEAGVVLLPPQPLKPVVRPPVTPQVLDESVEDLPAIEPREEGGPVWIVPDLKEDAPVWIVPD
jgi:hypothetical protein